MKKPRARKRMPKPTRKCLTGIKGFDQISEGGLPRDRATLVCGGPGSGKTLWGIDFLIKGAELYREPGLFMSFDESADQLYQDVSTLDMDLTGLVARKKIRIEHVILKRADIQEIDFNLEDILVRMEHAIDAIGAKRVVIDSIDSLFAGISDAGILSLEVQRLFRWFTEKNVTAIITCKPGKGVYSQNGLEEYVSDCLILLDNRVSDQVCIRRIRIVKYRGSAHGTNEYPFVIDRDGLSVIPITSAALDRPGTAKRVSTGIPSLDRLFGGARGGGYTKGSSILASGTAGTGKTSLASAFALSRCRSGERCLFLSYEESPGQLVQNMSSIGLDLKPLVKRGLLKIISTRPSLFGLEQHLLDLSKVIAAFAPGTVVIDPLTSLLTEGSPREIESMVTRVIDLLKSRGITGFFTSLVPSTAQNETSGEIGVSSLIDTWIVVRKIEEADSKRRSRGLSIVKSRGMNHSSDIHTLTMSTAGLVLTEMPAEPTAGRPAASPKPARGSSGRKRRS